MSSPTSSDGGDEGSPPSLSGFRYGVGLSFTVLTLIVTITLISYFCTRNSRTNQSLATSGRGLASSRVMITVAGSGGGVGEADRPPPGLNDAVLRSFPMVLYSQVKLHREQESKDSNSNNSLSCSICLSDYVDSDTLRLLPDCGHLFHLACVDSWLRQSATCPICRSSPIPTPLPTPLAEVTPLAGPPRQ